MAGHSRFLSSTIRNCICEHNSRINYSLVNNMSKRNLHRLIRRQFPEKTILSSCSKDSYKGVLNDKLLARIKSRSFHLNLAVMSSDPIELTNNVPEVINMNNESLIDTAQDVIANGLIEPSLSSLGLGGYSPIGIVQQIFEFSHITLGLPWWSAILCGTVILRAVVFPLMIKTQINAERLRRIQPDLERMQERMRDASNLQNPAFQATITTEMTELFSKNNCHPIKALLSPMIQLPLFISFFFALRGMSYLPIESMKTGGLFWFTDLTLQDPYFILPVLASATMLLTIETGADPGMAANPNANKMKNVFRGLCLIMVPLTYHFPAAIFNYWVTSNLITLGQALLLKQKNVRKYYGLPEKPFIPPVNPNVKSGSFFENFKAGFSNAQEAGKIKEEHKKEGLQPKKLVGDKYAEAFEYKPRVLQNDELFKKASRK